MKSEDIADYARYEFEQADSGAYGPLLLRIPVELEGARVLDLAAGPGTWTRLFDEAGASMAVWHDRSAEFLALARDHLAGTHGVECVVADLAELPYRDATFDLVFCRVSLHHSRDERRTITEIARVLKPGGVAALVTNRVGRVTRRVPLGWKKPLHYLTPIAAAASGRKVGPTIWTVDTLLRRRIIAAGMSIDTWDASDPEALVVFARRTARDRGATAGRTAGR